MANFFDQFDEKSGASTGQANPFDKFDDPNYKKPAGRGIGGIAGDTGISLLKGVIGVPEAAIGLADLATGGHVGKAAEAVGFRPGEAKSYLDTLYSDEQKAANQKVADAKGFIPTVVESLKNPSTIIHSAVESAPSMLVGGAVGRGIMAAAPRVGAVAAGAIGEGATAAGQNAEQVRQESKDGLLTAKQSAILAASGALTGGIGLGSGKIANKLGIGDVNTMLASGKLGAVGEEAIATGAKKGMLRKIGEGTAVEGVGQELGQSYQEQVAQNLAQEKPWDEGAAEAGAKGMLAGGLMGGAGGAFSANEHATQKTATPPVLALENSPDPYISFPDGTVGKKSDIESYVKGLPEDQQVAARARLLGMGAQQVDQPQSKPLSIENNPSPMVSFADGTVGTRADADKYINSLPEDQRIAARAKLMGMGEQPADVGIPASTVDPRLGISEQAAEERIASQIRATTPAPITAAAADLPGGADLHAELGVRSGLDQIAREAAAQKAASPLTAAADLAHATGAVEQSARARAAQAEEPLTKAADQSKEGDQNAIQEPGAGSVLQRQSEAVGETGGERGRVEQGQQGAEVAAAREAATETGNIPTEEINQAEAQPTAQEQEHVTQATEAKQTEEKRPESPAAAEPVAAQLGKEVARYSSRQTAADGSYKSGSGLDAFNAKQFAGVLNRANPGVSHAPVERDNGRYDVVGHEKAKTQDSRLVPVSKRVAETATPKSTTNNSENIPAAAQIAGAPKGAPRKTTPMDHPDLKDVGIRADLTRMKAEAGWAQVGGKIMRETADGVSKVTGRTQWIAHHPWYGAMPERLNAHETQAAVGKALSGLPMSAKEKRVISHMIDMAKGANAEIEEWNKAHPEEKVSDADYSDAIESLSELTDEQLHALADAPADLESGLRALGFTEKEIADELARETKGAEGATSTEQVAAGDAPGRAEQGNDQAQPDGFALKGQTEEEGRAQVTDKERQQVAGKADEQRAAEADRKAGIKKEIDQRQDSSADNFRLGQSAEDGLSGQKNLLEQKRDEYTKDLFGEKLPAVSGESKNPESKPAAKRSVDMDTADAVPSGSRFATRTKLIKENSREIGETSVNSIGDAAHALAYLGHGAVERFDALVTDKNGKPLAIVGSFKGALTQASIHPATIIGEAFRIKGAAHIWFAHNHPSGNSQLSSADHQLNKALSEAFRGSSIEAHPLLAISGGVKATRSWDAADGANGTIEKSRKSSTVSVVDRHYSEDGKLADAISSPALAKKIAVQLAHGDSGVLLLDVKNRPVAFVPVEDASLLRTKGRMDALYRAISMANSAASMIVNNGKLLPEGIRNLGALLNSVDSHLLDVFDVKDGSTTSWAEHGKQMASPVFFSRSSLFSIGMEAKEVQAEVDRLKSSWKNAPGIAIVQSASDLPWKVPADARGAFRNGKVYLVSDNIHSAADAQFVLFHETLGHAGLRGMLGDDMTKQMAALELKNKAIRDAAAKWREDNADIRGNRSDAQWRSDSIEETLADMAGQGKSINGIGKLAAAVQAGLRKIGLGKVADWMENATNAEVMAMLARARSHVEDGEKATVFGPNEAMAYSRDPKIDREKLSESIGRSFKDLVGKNDDAFQYPNLSGDKDLGKTIAQTGMPMQVRDMPAGDPKQRDKATKQYEITTPSGEKAYVYQFGKDVQLDASKLISSKSRGTAVYQAISSWAHANGFVFEGDAAGINQAGMMRRMENMISSILRHGSSDHLRPHPDQKGNLGFQWSTGSSDKNLGELLRASYNHIHSVIPDIDQVAPTEHGDFEKNGKLFAGDDFAKLAAAYRSAELRRVGGETSKMRPVGEATLARAAITGELLRRATSRDESQLRPNADGSPARPGIGAESVSQALYSRKPNDRSSYLGNLDPAQEAAARNIGAIKEKQTLKERLTEQKKNFSKNFVQGVADQFAPLKELDANAYLHARMSKASDGTLEALMMYGKPFLRDGVADVKIDEGFAKVLSSLDGEHDRFFMWVAAKRAEQLKMQGKENLFTDSDISALKTLNKNDAASPKRAEKFDQALSKLNEFNDAVLKVAVESGILSEEARLMFKDQPYVPFYRAMDGGGVAGGGKSSGLVNQYAFKKLKGGTTQLNQDLLANTLLNWSHLYSAAAKNRAAQASMSAAVRTGVAEEVPAGTKGAIKVLEGGQYKHYEVNDPHLYQAISALEQATPAWFKPFSTFKRIMTIGVTANPAFKIRNLIRDSVAAVAQSELSYNPAKNIAQGLKATSKDSQTFASMMASGGIVRFGSMLDGDSAEHAHRLIAAGVDKATILDEGGWKKMQRTLGHLVESYNELGDRLENVNRTALYEQMIKKGYNHAEASFASRDLLDFSMSGHWPVIRFLTQSVPFMNARIQGLYKLGRAAKEDPRRAGYVVGAVALASLALLAAYGNDDDWKKREDFDRDNYWWFKIGDKAFRIPKPFEIGAIGTLAERTWEKATDDEMTWKRYGGRMADTIFQQFSMNPIPQLAKPFMDVYANKDAFTNRPIESMGMEKLRPEDRYTDRTSSVARFLGSLGIPDPTQITMGRYAPLSPVQMDSLLKGYFGWLATAATTALDYGIRPLQGRGERADMKLRDTFLAGNFVESLPSGSSRYVTQLYDQAKEIEESYNSYRVALKMGDREKAASILETDRENIQKYRKIEAVKKAESMISMQIKHIESDKSMSGEDKRQKLNVLEARRDRLARLQ